LQNIAIRVYSELTKFGRRLRYAQTFGKGIRNLRTLFLSVH
jgi:hypothetical protein